MLTKEEKENFDESYGEKYFKLKENVGSYIFDIPWNKNYVKAKERLGKEILAVKNDKDFEKNSPFWWGITVYLGEEFKSEEKKLRDELQKGEKGNKEEIVSAIRNMMRIKFLIDGYFSRPFPERCGVLELFSEEFHRQVSYFLCNNTIVLFCKKPKQALSVNLDEKKWHEEQYFWRNKSNTISFCIGAAPTTKYVEGVQNSGDNITFILSFQSRTEVYPSDISGGVPAGENGEIVTGSTQKGIHHFASVEEIEESTKEMLKEKSKKVNKDKKEKVFYYNFPLFDHTLIRCDTAELLRPKDILELFRQVKAWAEAKQKTTKKNVVGRLNCFAGAQRSAFGAGILRFFLEGGKESLTESILAVKKARIFAKDTTKKEPDFLLVNAETLIEILLTDKEFRSNYFADLTKWEADRELFISLIERRGEFVKLFGKESDVANRCTLTIEYGLIAKELALYWHGKDNGECPSLEKVIGNLLKPDSGSGGKVGLERCLAMCGVFSRLLQSGKSFSKEDAEVVKGALFGLYVKITQNQKNEPKLAFWKNPTAKGIIGSVKDLVEDLVKLKEISEEEEKKRLKEKEINLNGGELKDFGVFSGGVDDKKNLVPNVFSLNS